MKILFNTYPMAFHTPGGGEIQLQQYRKHLGRRGVDVTLLDLWNPRFKDHEVVHYFSCMSGSLHFCAFVKNIGMPLVVSPNLWITEESKSNYPFDEIRLIFVLADRVVCNSNAECDLLARIFNIPREKFFTVYNGIDQYFLKPVDGQLFRESFGIAGKFVLNVANVEPRKNQLELVRALKAHPQLQLVLIGHVRDRAYADECFAEGGDQLRYIGPLGHESDLLRSAYSACSVFALPSMLETPGLAALEAFAAGVPVVVTREGCTREYFGAGATYVDPHDTAGIADAVEKSVDAPRSFLSTLVASANFTWARVVDRLVELYKDPANLPDTERLLGGFLDIEADGQHRFAWTRQTATFDCRPGAISGIWRTEVGGTVEVRIDGELAHQYVHVPADWTSFQIVVPEKEDCAFRAVTIELTGGAGSAERGVALRDVEFMEATTPGFKELEAFDELLQGSTGFFPIERDPHRYFAWSARRATFRSRPGHLNFVWRSAQGDATIDVLVAGKRKLAGVPVGHEWSRLSLAVEPTDGEVTSEVTLVVNQSQDVVVAGRVLGVAVGELQFQPWVGPGPTLDTGTLCA
ncbi:glycosyltransferase involved in cell wall biosynthesis [Trinickia symbiotica]|uniref:Glycosyl transferase n=1 Tax=Trinickia symbiotica TaxID=863227 RepID=A0A2N7X571_9BURK|nr:glycosyltransferase family 4 protein [Trinickia symbiotica]PMS36909.1 hypothetical protein C0Z20_09200 [Trinickia symbiotica]PPK45303.1 glycosyltransferase involved in cell wall biosynthesis [Trinickia symbiotica]